MNLSYALCRLERMDCVWNVNLLNTINVIDVIEAYSAIHTQSQQRFTISEVAADWHELIIPWRIMRPSIARDSGQLDPRCSTQHTTAQSATLAFSL